MTSQDLVTEKIRTQQLTNEIQRISVELERVGLDKEKLASAAEKRDDRCAHCVSCSQE